MISKYYVYNSCFLRMKAKYPKRNTKKTIKFKHKKK